MLEPTAPRFRVTGAPRPKPLDPTPESTISQASQTSLQIKQSRLQVAAKSSQRTDSISVEDSFPPPQTATDDSHPEPEVEIVEDSFLSSPSHSSPPAVPIETPKETPAPFNDALAEAIQQTKAVAHLPLDEEEEEEEESRLSGAGGDDSDSAQTKSCPNRLRNVQRNIHRDYRLLALESQRGSINRPFSAWSRGLQMPALLKIRMLGLFRY